MKVEPVMDRGGLAEFCALPLRIHPESHYVPMARQVLRDWWRGRGPHARYGPVEFFVVRDDNGRVVGRACLHRNPKFDTKLGGRHQLFGLTEFVDDGAVAACLFDLIAAKAAGVDAVFGPVALLPNQTGGVITSGFGERGFLDAPWNPPYYPATYERHGFVRMFEADSWICEDLSGDPGRLFGFDDARIETENLCIRYGSRRRFARQLPILREMLNASFAQLGYYTPIDADELAAQTDGLAFLLDEKLLLWLEKDGIPVAFIVVVPDVSEFMLRVRGNLSPANQLRLWVRRGSYRREAVLIIKGTVPGEQGKGYLTLLSRQLLSNLSDGYEVLRSTFVERDNQASAAQYKRMGGRPLHGHTFYRKALA